MAHRNQPDKNLSWKDSAHWLAEDEARRELSLRSGTERDWLKHARCRGADANVFHPNRGQSELPAKTICDECPVTLHCLTYALNASEKLGVWGGTSERGRRVLRRRSRERSEAEQIPYTEAIDVEIRLWSKREALKQEAKQRERQESIVEAQRLATEQPERMLTSALRPSKPKTKLNPQTDSRNVPEPIGDRIQPEAHGRTMRMKRTPNRKWRVRAIGAYTKTKAGK